MLILLDKIFYKMKSIKITCLSVLIVFIFSYTNSFAQISAEEIKSQYIADWERAKAYTMEYLDAMPDDKYSFKPVDSVRSFAQQMLHIAVANVGLTSLISGEPGVFGQRNLEMESTAQTKDSVKYLVMSSYDFVINAIQKMDMATLTEKVKFMQFEITKYAFLNKLFEHQTHHRGQTTIYIRVLGIRPPGEKLF